MFLIIIFLNPLVSLSLGEVFIIAGLVAKVSFAFGLGRGWG